MSAIFKRCADWMPMFGPKSCQHFRHVVDGEFIGQLSVVFPLSEIAISLLGYILPGRAAADGVPSDWLAQCDWASWRSIFAGIAPKRRELWRPQGKSTCAPPIAVPWADLAPNSLTGPPWFVRLATPHRPAKSAVSICLVVGLVEHVFSI